MRMLRVEELENRIRKTQAAILGLEDRLAKGDDGRALNLDEDMARTEIEVLEIELRLLVKELRVAELERKVNNQISGLSGDDRVKQRQEALAHREMRLRKAASELEKAIANAAPWRERPMAKWAVRADLREMKDGWWRSVAVFYFPENTRFFLNLKQHVLDVMSLQLVSRVVDVQREIDGLQGAVRRIPFREGYVPRDFEVEERKKRLRAACMMIEDLDQYSRDERSPSVLLDRDFVASRTFDINLFTLGGG